MNEMNPEFDYSIIKWGCGVKDRIISQNKLEEPNLAGLRMF